MNAEKILNWVAIVVVPLVIFALTPLWNSTFADKKKLEYWTLGKTRVNDEMFGVSAKTWPEVKATYQGKELTDATFLRIIFVNSGGVPIKPEDFEGPIVFVSSPTSRVLQHRLIRAEPKSLKPKFSIVDTGVQLAPLLLNPGDMFILELFASDNFDKQVDGRIAGLRSIGEYTREKYSGLSIEHVKEVDYGRSEQRRLLRLPLTCLGFMTFAILVMSILGLRLNSFASRPYPRAIIFVECMTLYAIGLFGARLIVDVLAAEGSPTWVNYLLFFSVVIIPVVFGLHARRLFPAPRLSSVEDSQRSSAPKDEV